MYVIGEPGTDNLWVVLRNEGQEPARVIRFKNDDAAAKYDVLLEIPQRMIYALCFDPAYATNRQVYLFSNGPTPEPQRVNRVVRFTVSSPDGQDKAVIDPKSEEVDHRMEVGRARRRRLAFGARRHVVHHHRRRHQRLRHGWTRARRSTTCSAACCASTSIDATAIVPYAIPPGQSVRRNARRPPARSGPTACAIPGGCALDSQDRPHLGRQQRPGPLGDGLPGPPRRQLRLERLRGQPSVLPPAASAGRRRSVLPTIEHSHAEFRSLTGGVVYHGDGFPTWTAPTSTATTRAAASGA